MERGRLRLVKLACRGSYGSCGRVPGGSTTRSPSGAGVGAGGGASG
jgi:hypothetical protein